MKKALFGELFFLDGKRKSILMSRDINREKGNKRKFL